MSRLLPWLPLFAVLSVAAMAAGSIGAWLRLDPRPLLPHVLVAAALTITFYSAVGILSVVVKGRRRRTCSIAITGAAFGIGWAAFYSLLFATLLTVGDLPSRALVAGFLSDLPMLARALPIDVGLVVAGLSCWFAGMAAVAFVFAKSMQAFAAHISSEQQRFAISARIGAYGGAVAIVIGAMVPPDFLLASREPFVASWHNVRLRGHSQYAQADPSQSAADQRAEQRLALNRPARRPNVILIYIDGLRADTTQPYGGIRENMPFVAALVASGQLAQIDFVLSPCSATICGLAGLLQSRETRRQDPNNLSLPKVLARFGYRTAYVLSSNHQSYFDLKRYYEPTHFYVDGNDLDPSRSFDDYLVLDGLARLGRWDGRPTFLMIGLVSPHVFGHRLERNRRYLPDRAALIGGASLSEAFVNNYHNGIVQSDDVLRLVWDWLQAAGYLNDAIVAITADHGESLGERGIFGHVKSLYNTELRVPLWFGGPALPPLQRRDAARLIDVAPTLLDALGVPTPETWQGRTLASPAVDLWSEHFLPDRPRTVAVIHWSQSQIVKLIFDKDAGTEQVFELRTDPLERVDARRHVDARLVQEARRRAMLALAGR